ncbi:MAG: sigma 54-interacting transcriptional regulator [Tissierella sp.]|nr:sigma 54-interacting transcriptional regulator [Tissierella sp.]
MLDKRSTEIALIAPTIELEKKTIAIIKERNDNIDVYLSDSKVDAIEDALRIARQLEKHGTKIIISRKGTAEAIRNAKIEVEVVVINTVLSDYIEAMEIAKQYNGIIAFFSYDDMTDDVKTVCQMLGINAKYYTFKTDRDCERLTKEALRDGAVLGIGGSMNRKYAEIYNLEHITIENTETSIVTAIETAEQILLVKKEEFNKQQELQVQLERYKAVLNFTHDAVIAIDEKGIVDVINPIAEQIIKVAPGYAIGKKIDDIIKDSGMVSILRIKEPQLNDIMDVNGTLVSTNRIPIIVENQVKGVVATFQDIKIIQENENRIRRRLSDKGLIAKYSFHDIKGESKSLKNTVQIAKSYAKSDSTILIQGETGTGKELFAQSVHKASKRKDGPFVAINCAALSKSLLESELFGYTEGAFTGAIKGGKIGLFELAHKGTIFLDEIGEIPIEIQAQLLRVLQEREIRRIGSDITTPVDVRVITATNRDLKAEINDNLFREDLYYRISVLNLYIPPLRKRDDDINLLSNHFFERYLGRKSREYKNSFNAIMEKVKDYKWYGNVRELQNFVERISVLITYHDDFREIDYIIDEFILDNQSHKEMKAQVELVNTNQGVDLSSWEEERIRSTLIKNNLSIQDTAKELDISRTTLWRKMKQYNITY